MMSCFVIGEAAREIVLCRENSIDIMAVNLKSDTCAAEPGGPAVGAKVQHGLLRVNGAS